MTIYHAIQYSKLYRALDDDPADFCRFSIPAAMIINYNTIYLFKPFITIKKKKKEKQGKRYNSVLLPGSIALAIETDFSKKKMNISLIAEKNAKCFLFLLNYLTAAFNNFFSCPCGREIIAVLIPLICPCSEEIIAGLRF